MKKLCVLLCLLLTLAALVACGDKDKDKDSDEPSESTNDPSAQEEGLRLTVGDDFVLGVGETKTITAINGKTGMQTTNILWESDDTSVASVDFEGKVTGNADGTTVITATSIDGETASCTVTVTSVLTGITLDPSELIINIGDRAELTVGFIPESFTGAELTWVSSDDSIASIDENGIVTAHAVGSTTIAVKTTSGEEEFTAVCSVTVANPVTSVTLSQQSISLVKGEKKQLNATILPANATDSSLTWTSSNPSAVSVAQDGTLTALAGGNATITAKSSNGMSATCKVEVKVPVTGITLKPSSVNLDPNTSQKLVASIAPVDANVQDVIWSSSNPTVVSVDAAGRIMALKAGTATITVTSVEGYYTATCKVTVPNIITSLTFEQPEGSLLIGQTLILQPVKAPENADETTLTWTSSDPEVATVDENGLVTALKEGKITITVATDKEVSATYTLTVIDPATINVPIQSIRADSMVVEEGETFNLNVTVTPSNATEEYVITSGNPSCVVVNSDGTLSALRKGTLFVTVATKDGRISTRCLLTVSEMPADKKAEKQKEYDDALAVIDKAHGEVIVGIESRYDSDIEKYTLMVNNAAIKSEADYKQQKSAIEKAIASANASDKAVLQRELESLKGEWEAYQQAYTTLQSLQQSKDSELNTENALYAQNLADLKAQYPYLF